MTTDNFSHPHLCNGRYYMRYSALHCNNLLLTAPFDSSLQHSNVHYITLIAKLYSALLLISSRRRQLIHR